MNSADWRKKFAELVAGKNRIVFLGIGHREKGDDGIGTRLVESLQKRYENRAVSKFTFIPTGEMPENYSGAIRSARPELVIIIDLATGIGPPGTIDWLKTDQIRSEELTTHKLPLTILIDYIERSIGCPVEILGIQGEGVTEGTKPGMSVTRAQRRIKSQLIRLIEY